jgi:hypothetical protein
VGFFASGGRGRFSNKMGMESTEGFSMFAQRGNRLRAFWDFFILFSGISTASNLARTQGRRLLTRGIFLFRAR